MIDPGDNITSMAYSAGGLLDSLTDANGHRTTFTWGTDGRLNRDTDAASGYQDLSESSALSRIRTVWRETALGRTTKYEASPRDDGTVLRSVTSPANLVTTMNQKLDTRVETTLPDGTVVTNSITGDPRFSIVAPVPAENRTRLPSGTTRVIQVKRPYSASTFDPPTAVATPWIEEMLLNGTDTLLTEFDARSHRMTIQGSLARRTTVTVDTAGRPIAIHVPGLDTLRRAYDGRGRLTVVRRGNRGMRMGYDGRGRLAVVRDTLGRMTTLGYDNADRLISHGLPGGRATAYGYDPVGNLTQLTPPSGAVHSFDYNPIDLTSKYHPPGAGMADSLTEYVYNLDGQLTDVLRPDDANVAMTYGSATGRTDEVTTPRGDVAFAYDGVGRLATLSAPDGVTVTYGYDGPLPVSETWSGAIGGSVAITPDQAFRVAKQRINGANEVDYSYDRDGLLTQAGALSIARSPSNGRLVGTTFSGSSLVTSVNHNRLGEPELVVALLGVDTLWRALYTRDAVGRITAITEKVLGASTIREFAYSDTGFLERVSANGSVTERYDYDANGNRRRFDAPGDSATGTYDAQDRLTRYRDTRYVFSTSGELQEKSAGTDTTRYSYDPFGNLLWVRFQSGDIVTYVIDGRNRRVGRKLNGSIDAKMALPGPVGAGGGAGWNRSACGALRLRHARPRTGLRGEG